MITNKLAIISPSMAEAASYGILKPDKHIKTIISGDGGDNYACGNCGNVLMENFGRPFQISNMALYCNECDTINDGNVIVSDNYNPPMFSKLSKNRS